MTLLYCSTNASLTEMNRLADSFMLMNAVEIEPPTPSRQRQVFGVLHKVGAPGFKPGTYRVSRTKWTVQDLNLQPLRCKRSALPIELTVHFKRDIELGVHVFPPDHLTILHALILPDFSRLRKGGSAVLYYLI